MLNTFVAPTGPTFLKSGDILFRGMMIMGETNVPAALKQHMTVKCFPLSQDPHPKIPPPICLTPLGARIRTGFWTVFIPVSSKFNILLSENLYFFKTVSRYLHYVSTYS